MIIEAVLFSYLDAKRRCETIRAKQKMIEQELLPKSPAMTGMPSSHNKNDKMAAYMVKLEEVQRDYAKALKTMTEKMQEVESLIAKVEDTTLWQVLNYRYIMGNSWKTIAEVMNYSEQNIYILRTKALDAVAKALDDCR